MVSRVSLRPGYAISRLIKGHWQVAEGHGSGLQARDNLIADMRAFAEAGITTFDVADIYTGAEELIGDFIGASNARIEVHTKYVPDLNLLSTLTFEDTACIIERSLKRLKMERLDFVQFHWWDYTVPGYVEAALHLARLQREGKIRYIGVTNFDQPRLREMLGAGVDIASAQVQYSLIDRRPETSGFTDFCRANDISLLCYGTLAGGYLSARHLGVPDRAAADNRSLTKYRLMIEETGGYESYQAFLRDVDALGRSSGLDISDIAVAYILQKPGVVACIVGVRDQAHLARLTRLAALCLPSETVQALDALVAARAAPPGDIYTLERTADRHKGIMKYNLNRADEGAGRI